MREARARSNTSLNLNCAPWRDPVRLVGDRSASARHCPGRRRRSFRM